MTQMTGNEETKRAKLGRPRDDTRSAAFLKVVKYLEDNDDEQISISDLIDPIEDKLANTTHEAYSYLHMEKRLKEHFGVTIVHD